MVPEESPASDASAPKLSLPTSLSAEEAPSPPSPEIRKEILGRVRRYYTEKVESHGSTPAGVDWSSEESQRIRFGELLRIAEGAPQPFSINDYGCGYGGLIDELERRDLEFTYRGFDVSREMVLRARELYGDRERCTFTTRPEELRPADFTLASGIFNVRLDFDEETWTSYVRASIHELARLSIRGFAFNVLTAYVDPGRDRKDLFYADPGEFFAYCKRHVSRWVALLHDYGLYEFTLLIRRDERHSWQS